MRKRGSGYTNETQKWENEALVALLLHDNVLSSQYQTNEVYLRARLCGNKESRSKSKAGRDKKGRKKLLISQNTLLPIKK